MSVGLEDLDFNKAPPQVDFDELYQEMDDRGPSLTKKATFGLRKSGKSEKDLLKRKSTKTFKAVTKNISRLEFFKPIERKGHKIK